MRCPISVTPEDMQRLRRLIDGLKSRGHADDSNVDALEEELDRAHLVPSDSIRSDVITLNSQVLVRDLDDGRTMEYEIVYPNTRPRSSVDGLSVLAPLGTALLGCRAGDVIEWRVPKGRRRIQVVAILYQPEAAKTSAA